MSSQFAERKTAGSGHLPVAAEAGLQSLYGQLYFGPEAAFGGLSAADLVGVTGCAP